MLFSSQFDKLTKQEVRLGLTSELGTPKCVLIRHTGIGVLARGTSKCPECRDALFRSLVASVNMYRKWGDVQLDSYIA